MPEPAAPLVPVTSETKDEVTKTDDAGNRAVRTGANVGAWGVLIYFVNKYTSLNVDEQDVLLALPFLTAAASWLLNIAEYNGWIPALKPKEAVYAPPKDTAGNVLGQVKP